MITFDKLKIVFPSKYVEVLGGFRTVREYDDSLIRQTYRQTKPCYIFICVDNMTRQARIEFTGKILKEKYYEGINLNNIKSCLDAVNGLGVCRLEVTPIIEEAKVEKCDVIKDVDKIDLSALRAYIVNHIANYNKWVADTYQQNHNVRIRNNVQKREQQKILTIYDKEADLKRSKNKSFLLWTGDSVLQKMNGKTRLELKLNHYNLVEGTMQIPDRQLLKVLNSSANPIRDFLGKALCEDTESYPANKWTEYKNQCIMMQHKWDLRSLEFTMRHYCGKNYNSNMMKPFRELVNRRNRSQTPTPQFDFQTMCSFDKNSTTTVADYSPITSDYWMVNDGSMEGNAYAFIMPKIENQNL